MDKNYLNELSDKLKNIESKKMKNQKTNDNRKSSEVFNELYLCLVSNIDNKEEYEYFLNIYRNEEFDFISKNSKKSIDKLQKNLNHSFGILPLDKFNSNDFDKLEELYDMEIDDLQLDED